MKMLFQFRHRGGKPTLEEVQQRFALTPDEVDQKYGVTLIDPEDGSYVIRVEDSAEQRLRGYAGGSEGGAGIFSDPKIAPFGPPES